jgi:hypothetical protein
MRPSRSHPPESRRLLVVGSVRRIIGGLDFREPLHADGVDLGDPVLEGGPFDVILYLAIPENAFQGDELPLLESLGELREIPPGKDAMPFSAGFVLAFVVFPALLGCDVEGDVIFVVLSGFGFCVLPEAADEDDCLRYMLAQRVWRRDPLPRRLDGICGRGPQLAWGQESAPRRGAQRILGRRACVRRAGVS